MFAADPPHDDDVIALVKLHMSSPALLQAPLLVLPGCYLAKLGDRTSLTPLGRNPLGQHVAQEFLKTAEAVGRWPWDMTAAQTYLTEFVRRNEAGTVDEPMPIDFLFKDCCGGRGVFFSRKNQS